MDQTQGNDMFLWIDQQANPLKKCFSVNTVGPFLKVNTPVEAMLVFRAF